MEIDKIVGQRAVSPAPAENHRKTAELIGYVPRPAASPDTYTSLGFKCGLEIHQQLLTAGKLFCRCPAGIYHDPDDFDAEVVRHMRPTLSEMGEYDGTALMEKKTRKNITYRLNNKTACTYEIDDTPPFKIDREALNIAIEIALLLKTNVVGELHITRKQYLDGSIPTGFQRTAIVGIEGEIPISSKTVRIIQLSIEEDACREVSDFRHDRVYTTDRLGMPLIETVTYPDMLTPDEAAEAGQYLRFLARSTGHVRTGIGAARQDVNVSIEGGTRVEIKGVAHIKWIPELTHNEAFRQRALLEIRRILIERVRDQRAWKMNAVDIGFDALKAEYPVWREFREGNARLTAINLPHFANVLSFFTQPNQSFSDELAGRVKVIACLEHPNLLHSEQADDPLGAEEWAAVRTRLSSEPDDAQLLVWGPSRDVDTALETIEERCRMAFEGVPNETRKSLPDGTTIFERVLPGPDRMYPDTDSAPVAINENLIEDIRAGLPRDVSERMARLREWKVPRDTWAWLLGRNLVPVMERIVRDFQTDPAWLGTLFGHRLKHLEGTAGHPAPLDPGRLYELVAFISKKKLSREILYDLLSIVYRHPDIEFEKALNRVGYKPYDRRGLAARIRELHGSFVRNRRCADPNAPVHWIMGRLRAEAIGNLPLKDVRTLAEEEVSRG